MQPVYHIQVQYRVTDEATKAEKQLIAGIYTDNFGWNVTDSRLFIAKDTFIGNIDRLVITDAESNVELAYERPTELQA